MKEEGVTARCRGEIGKTLRSEEEIIKFF